ncbi:CPSF A subunit region-domain-containing protein [Myxozyma melibiosi]|uniref:CPSF A subunit region-domain-containing protein n=1 Tax=Myxozyma melibiosi TaxID=54550 RepID=A0ABR1FBV6_9ASCO
MQVYRDITQPTAITHCVSANLISPDQPNLVVVKGSSLLQIFTFVSHESQSSSTVIDDDDDAAPSTRDHSSAASASANGQQSAAADGDQQDQTDDNFLADIGLEQSLTTYHTKLVLVAEYALSGFVTGIVRVRTAADPRLDYVLLSFASAKMSLLSWDHARHTIATVSLHYYENQSGVFSATFNTDVADSAALLRADPGNFCACFKFGSDMFAFLPFRKEDDDLELFTGAGVGSSGKNGEISRVFYPSFVVPASMLSDDIENVIDAVFLYEYREPTLAILYQPKRTWTGLIHETKDTTALIVVALDLQQRASTAILSISKLPYDLVSATALPAPIGGTLLLGANEIVHVDPAGRAVSIAVNPFAAQTSEFDFIDQSDLELRLEGSKAVYLQDNLVLLILGTGDLCLLRFMLEGRSVERLELHRLDLADKLVGGAASCLEIFWHKKRLFVGCAAADGVLLSWRKSGDTRRGSSSAAAEATEDASSALEAEASNDNSNLVKSKEYDDVEDEDLYGESSSSGAANSTAAAALASLDEAAATDSESHKKFSFLVHDRLVNHGPLLDVAIGSVEVRGNVSQNAEVSSKLEVVGARGGLPRSGGLSVFRRSLTPRVSARFAFPDCKALFTVKTKSRDTLTSGVDSAIGDQVDKYMIISRADESVVYDISERFEEVRGTEFDPRGATLGVGSILDGTRIVQLCATEIRVYDSDLKMVQMLPVYMPPEDEDETSADWSASGADPGLVAYSFSQNAVLLLLDNGAANLLIGGEQSLELNEEHRFEQGIEFSAGCLASVPKSFLPGTKATKFEVSRKRKRTTDIIYGTSTAANNSARDDVDDDEDSTVDVAIMVTRQGELQIYRISDLKLMYSIKNCDVLPQLIERPPESSEHPSSRRPSMAGRRRSSMGVTASAANDRVNSASGKEYHIVEVLYASLGDSVMRQNHLFLRTADGDVAIYEPFVPPSGSGGSSALSVGVRFLKVQNIKVASSSQPPASEDAEQSGDAAAARRNQLRVSVLFPLVNQSGYDTVFIADGVTRDNNSAPASSGVPAGPDIVPPTESLFVVKTARSLPKAIPFAGGPGVKFINPFHSITVDYGFIYVSRNDMVRVCKLQDEYSLDGAWPAKKITMDEEIHAIAYHSDQRMYVASVSKETQFSSKEQEEERLAELEDADFPASVDQGSLKLISPRSWITVDSYDFAPNETALVVRAVNLQLSESSRARRKFIAVGTGVFYGEDQPSKGFVYIFEIIEVVPEPGKPEHNHKLKLIVKEDVRGVVSTLCEINGHLLSAQGQKVMVRALREDMSFLPVAFMDMNMYVSDAKSIKNMILLGDIMKSVWFVGFSEDPYKMQLFGKDLRHVEVVASDFVISGDLLHFVIADANRKIHILQYDPDDPRSLSGQRLIAKSEFFTGHNIEAFTIIPQAQLPIYPTIAPSTTIPPASAATAKGEAADGSTENGESDPASNDLQPTPAPPTPQQPQQQQMCLGVTQSGNLVSVHPVSEMTYRRLVVVQQQMAEKYEHVAGLNPRMYRSLSANAELSGSATRVVLDGNLLLRFPRLPLNRQIEISERAGKGAEAMIWNHLFELEKSLSYM